MNENAKDEAGETIEDARQEKLSELEILKQSLEEKKQLAEENFNQLVRLKAEFENFRRRTEREKQNHLAWGKEEVLLKQVGLLDVMEQAASTVVTPNNVESIKKGMELINQEFVKMLNSEGIAETDCLGKKFDPAYEEAVDQVESDQPEGTVVEIIQKGYMLKDRLIRPARVKVAKNTKDSTKN